MTYPTKQQANHYDPDSAFVIERFPFAYAQFTSIRYWVESKPSYGQRLMTQVQNPVTFEWYKPKTDGYHDIVVITTIDDPSSMRNGFVVPVQINLLTFDLPTLIMFAEYYTFTPGQKLTIMKEFQRRKSFARPKWREDLVINLQAAERSENSLKPAKVALRKKDANGFFVGSEVDAEADERRAKRATYKSNDTPRVKPAPTADDDSTEGMTEEQARLYNELMGKQ